MVQTAAEIKSIASISGVASKHKNDEDHLRVMTDSVPLPIFIQTIDNRRILYANDQWLEILGQKRNDVLNQPLTKFFDSKATEREFYKKLHEDQCVTKFEARLHLPNGQKIFALISAKILIFHHKKSILISFFDMTERVKILEELRQAKEKAEFANRSKSEFLANVSHELRTPLNAIIGFAEMIKSQVFGEINHLRYLEYAKDICDSGVHLLALINDILDLSKIEAKQFDLHEKMIDIGQPVETSMRMMRDRSVAGQVTLVNQLPKDLPMILADERAIKQMLINLLSNAIKYTPPGGKITVTGYVDKRGLVVSVEDTGIGISKHDVARILEPFAQIENLINRRYHGTGLGLPLVKSLIKHHGGSLSIKSRPNKGSKVSIRFPMKRVLSKQNVLPLDFTNTVSF